MQANGFNRSIRRFWLVVFSAFICLSFAACSEEDKEENEFEDWQKRNEAFFSEQYSKASGNMGSSWRVITSWSFAPDYTAKMTDNIVVNILEEGTGSQCPIYTDSVLISYRGSLMPTKNYPEGIVFDETYSDEFHWQTAKPVKMRVKDLVDGFTTALMHMHIGDRWRVYIPYELGYGTSTSGSIPAYSTLVFDIALNAYCGFQETLPQYGAKCGVWTTE